MQDRRVRYAPAFFEALAKLPDDLQQATRDAIRYFIQRSAETRLRIEKKQGNLKDVWAFRLPKGHRVFFTQDRDQEGRRVATLFHVGPHDDYRTVERKKPR